MLLSVAVFRDQIQVDYFFPLSMKQVATTIPSSNIIGEKSYGDSATGASVAASIQALLTAGKNSAAVFK